MWNFRQYDSNIALIEADGRTWTYSELHADIDAFQERIRDDKSLIFILSQNNLESIVAYFSALENQHVPLLLNADIHSELLTELIQIYQPNYIWLPNSYDFESVDYHQQALGSSTFKLFEQISFMNHAMHPTLALLLTTSGSTGNPKLIRISQENIDSNRTAIASYLKLSSKDRAITTLPMNYTYGLSIINSHLSVGASVVLTDASIVDKEFWSLFELTKPTSFNGVPYTYQLLKRLLKPNNFQSLRYMTQAGGRLGKTLQEYFVSLANQHGIDFYVMYGQTEATARMAYLHPKRALDKLDSIGQAIPGGQFELMDDQGNVIHSSHTLGELVYYGPNVSMGYALSLEDLSKGDEWLGRLATGDLALVDEEGFYFIQGRLNRYVKVYGVRINLDDVERALQKMINQWDLAVVGEEDMIHVFTTLEFPSQKIQEVASKFLIHPSVFRSHILDEIPKNPAGKVMYSSLIERTKR